MIDDLYSLRLVPAGPERDAFWPLFLLADDSESHVRAYYQTGDLYVLEDARGNGAGFTLVIPFPDPPDEGTVELKAVAIDAAWHGRGLGKRMLALVLAVLRERSVRRVVVGTGNSGIGQIAFYQKSGFRMWRIERDVFSEARGYPPGLAEHGIPLRDMIWFEQLLERDS